MPCVEIKITPKLSVIDVKKQLIEEFSMENVKPSELIVCCERFGEVRMTFKDHDLIKDVETGTKKMHIMVYHVPKDDPESHRVELNFHRFVKMNKNRVRID